jgi:hypothetical protein
VRADLERKQEKKRLREERRVRRRRVRWGVILAIILHLIAGLGYYVVTAWRPLGGGDRAPDFALPDQHGRTVRLVD